MSLFIGDLRPTLFYLGINFDLRLLDLFLFLRYFLALLKIFLLLECVGGAFHHLHSELLFFCFLLVVICFKLIQLNKTGLDLLVLKVDLHLQMNFSLLLVDAGAQSFLFALHVLLFEAEHVLQLLLLLLLLDALIRLVLLKQSLLRLQILALLNARVVF